jgi:hypothetical protein
MNDLRESHLIIKSDTFDSELSKLRVHFKTTFGANEYEANLNKIKQLSVEPSENVFVVSHEFSTEEAAQNAATKINNIYENMLSQLGPLSQVWETPRTQGRTLILCLRIPEEFAMRLSMIQPSALGEITSADQYFEVEVSGYSPTKELFEDSSSDSNLAIGSFLKFALVTHKDLPIKVAELLVGVGGNTASIVGSVLSSLKRVHFDFGIQQPTNPNKETLKNQLVEKVQTLYTTLAPSGLYEVVKSMGETIKGTICISPTISLDLTIFAPAFPETLNIVKPPNL